MKPALPRRLAPLLICFFLAVFYYGALDSELYTRLDHYVKRPRA